MSDCGPFIDKLRNGWKQMVDDQRSDSHRAAQFRLTVVSGMKDTFVPQESALDPFPLDEHEIAPGNHTEMVKPVVVGELPYQILKKRLLRRTPTASQRRLINGEDEEVLREMNRIRAAAELDDIETLTELATKLLAQTDSLLPLVDRALGLALLGHEQYQQAAALLNRYVKFRMPDDQSQPFRSDAQAIQQLAIALSGSGDLAGAVAGLRELPVQMQEDPETQGILAGRFKRQWLKSKSSLSLGRRTFQLYKAAYEKAQSAANLDQIFYNGVNAAYLDFALGGADYKVLASEVLARCKEKTPPDYWSEATCAEAHLLLRQYAEASTAYKKAIACGPAPRHFTSTGQQALDIIKRQGNPEGAAEIITLFAGIRSDY